MSTHPPDRKKLPKRRVGHTIKMTIKGSPDTDIYLTTGEYEDGSLGEIFLRVSKQGSTLAGLMDVFAIAISIGLQNGVPLSVYENVFKGIRFEPRGDTDMPDIPKAESMADLVIQYLVREYGKKDET